jgi:5,10-methylenetetrahydrofolate reductase
VTSPTRASETFEVIAEIDPPVGPDLARVRDQIDGWRPVASRFLVPDNHLGRATVSSIVVAHRVGSLGAPAIACLNARDRNLLGVRRDLLTARHLGVDELLLVYGDRPTVGERASGMTVRTMVEECVAAGMRCGVTTRLAPLPVWKRHVDRLFVQVSWSIGELLRWRDANPHVASAYAGVMVLASAAMARRVGAQIPELRAPDALVDSLEHDRDAGVRWAASMVSAIRESGAFAGAHLIAGRRHAEIVSALHESLDAHKSVGPVMERTVMERT